MSKTSKTIYFFISVLFFIFFDIYFSNAIIENIPNFSQNSVFDLIFTKNTGAAFSILQNSKMFLISFSVFAILYISIFLVKSIQKASAISIFWTAMLVSGIFCNMYERIVFGYVRDFIQLNFVDFPVFNLSDIFINVSVFSIVVIIIANEINNRRNSRRKTD